MTNGIECKTCKEKMYYKDELVFFLGDENVHVDEQSPDWDSAMCTSCADSKGLI